MKLTPMQLVDWAFAVMLASFFVSCGIAAVVGALR